MRQTQRPQSKVRSGVGDATETELNGMDGLMHHEFTKIKFPAMTVSTAAGLFFAKMVILTKLGDLRFMAGLENAGLDQQHDWDR